METDDRPFEVAADLREPAPGRATPRPTLSGCAPK